MPSWHAGHHPAVPVPPVPQLQGKMAAHRCADVHCNSWHRPCDSSCCITMPYQLLQPEPPRTHLLP